MSNGNITREFIDDVLKLVDEKTRYWTEALDDILRDAHIAQTRPTEEQLLAFFERAQSANPNYPASLQFVEGGPQELKRAARAALHIGGA